MPTNNTPIWDNYPLWAGVYGSYDDALFRQPGFGSTFVPIGPNVEEAQYDEYLRRRSGRYLNLPVHPRSDYQEHEFEDYSHRYNLNLSILISQDVFQNVAYALVRARPAENKLKRFLATLLCGAPQPVLTDELWRAMQEDAPFTLENVRRMQAIFAPATFAPNPYRVKFDTELLSHALPDVSENDVGLVADLSDFRALANLNYRARECGVDLHVGYANRARTSNNGGGSNSGLFDTVIAVLIKTKYPGDWQNWGRVLKNNRSRACVMSETI